MDMGTHPECLLLSSKKGMSDADGSFDSGNEIATATSWALRSSAAHCLTGSGNGYGF
jgi:hypothetical protein